LLPEVESSLVGLPDFKSGATVKSCRVGSIPMHFRQIAVNRGFGCYA
jgi:hypothetical protein